MCLQIKSLFDPKKKHFFLVFEYIQIKEMVIEGVYSVFVCLLIGLVLSTKIELCYGGISSDYVRNYNSNGDMLLNSDVFQVPTGYNAPQQVFLIFILLIFEF